MLWEGIPWSSGIPDAEREALNEVRRQILKALKIGLTQKAAALVHGAYAKYYGTLWGKEASNKVSELLYGYVKCHRRGEIIWNHMIDL